MKPYLVCVFSSCPFLICFPTGYTGPKTCLRISSDWCCCASFCARFVSSSGSYWKHAFHVSIHFSDLVRDIALVWNQPFFPFTESVTWFNPLCLGYAGLPYLWLYALNLSCQTGTVYGMCKRLELVRVRLYKYPLLLLFLLINLKRVTHTQACIYACKTFVHIPTRTSRIVYTTIYSYTSILYNQ